MNTIEPTASGHGTQRRNYKRVPVDLPGRLFLPAQSRETPCAVANISPGGAAIECETAVERDTQIVLYVDGFGRFDGRVARQDGATIGIRFDCTTLKRERIAEQLDRLASDGAVENSALRRHARTPASGSVHFTCSNGQLVPCQVLDLSPSGVNVKTGARPLLGEFVLIGKRAGRVVRHHEQGVGIEFIGGPPDGSH